MAPPRRPSTSASGSLKSASPAARTAMTPPLTTTTEKHRGDSTATVGSARPPPLPSGPERFSGTSIRPKDAPPAPFPLAPELAQALSEVSERLGAPVEWPEPAQRELAGHLDEFGLAPDVEAPLEHIARGELALAQQWETTLAPREMARAIRRTLQAQTLQAEPHAALFAFTRLIDARFRFTPEVLVALSESIAMEAGGRDALLRSIDEGPLDETRGRRPSSKVELVSALVRQLILGAGASLQLDISSELATWLEACVRRSGTALDEAMGGAAAFGANIAGRIPGVTSRFFTRERLPAKVDAAFGRSVEYLGPDGERLTREEAVNPQAPVRINFSCEYRQAWKYTLFGASTVRVNGTERPVVPGGTGRVILGTPTDFVPGFGALSKRALERLGREHALFFAVGIHYFTRGSAEAAAEKASLLASQLTMMKEANPKLLRHFQYVVPKEDALEVAVLRPLRGRFESMSLNAVELPGLLSRLQQGGMLQREIPRPASRDEAETLSVVVRGAALLAEAMGLERVHIHGSAGDLVLQPTPMDCERVIQSHLRARQLASMKAANLSGQIREEGDVWPINPIVTAQGLAGAQAFARVMQERYGLDESMRGQIVDQGWWTDVASGQTWFFAPTRGIHEDTGGKVSLGDTMDLVPLLLREGVSPS